MNTPDDSRPRPAPVPPHLRWALPKPLQLDEEPMAIAYPEDPLASLRSAGNLYLKARRRKGAATPDAGLIGELAVESWRLEKRLKAARPELGERNARALDASANRLRDLLTRAKADWKDPTGDAYNDGMRSVRVLAFEEVEGIGASEQKIIETVRPVVYIDERVAVPGDVIVGTAAKGGEDASND